MSVEGAKGTVQYTDRGPSERFRVRSQAIDALACDGAAALITGVARIKGKSVDFTIDLVDGGNAGGEDTYRLQLSNGYDSGTQPLTAGNVQVRSR